MKFLPNILIVDDLQENLFLLSRILQKEKINLIEALSGEEALIKTKGIELALAIVDVRMPVMNGYQLAEKLNADKNKDKIPIIFATANYSDTKEMEKGYLSGAVDYLVKPINPYILLSKIKVFMDLFNQKQTIILDAAVLKKSAGQLLMANASLLKSEEKYRSYLNNAPLGIFIINLTGSFLEVNVAMCEITGYSEQELLGMSVYDILSQDELRKVMVSIPILVKSGILSGDILFKNKTGSLLWGTVETVMLSAKRFLCFAKDITNQKVAEQILMETKEELKSLIENRSELIWSIDKNYNYITFNSLCYLTHEANHNIQIAKGSKSIEILLPELRKQWKPKYEEALSGRKVMFEFLTQKQDHFYYYEAFLNPIFSDKKITGVSVISINITERKQNEEVMLKMKKAIHNSTNVVFITDIHGTITFINPEFTKIYGYTAEEIVGKATSRILDNGNYSEKEHKKLWKSLLDKRSITATEFVNKCKNGQLIDVEGSMDTIIEDHGNIIGFIAIQRDITRRKLAEKELKASEKKYKTILNASPDGILIINLKGIIIDVSEMSLELFSIFNKNKLIGNNLNQFIVQEEKDNLEKIIITTINQGISQNVEMNFKKKNQLVFIGEISSTLIQDSDARPFSIMISIRDISERKIREKKLFHSDRMVSLGEMASGIAHEINQPLNTISFVMDNVMYEAAQNENIERDYLKKKSDKIFENITRIKNIIDHVRAFSRSHDDYVLADFSVNVSIKNAVMMMTEQFKHITIRVDLQLTEKLPLIIGNALQFEQVILNMLSNAKDALMEKRLLNTEPFESLVIIKSFLQDQSIIIEVEDNGKGIDKEGVGHITLPFYTTKDTGKGTGLGLAISYQIIKELGGTMDIASTPLQGTTISITLPISKP